MHWGRGVLSETPNLPEWHDLPFYADMRERWARLVQKGKFPRVSLLAGRRGLGKKKLASQLAAMFFCQTKTGCGTCPACREVCSGQHPEVLWIESTDGKLKIEAAQALQEHLALQPEAGMPARIVVLIRCEDLMKAAANRLLKILEEPPPLAQIILTSDSPRALLPTILSRAIRFAVAPPPKLQSFSYLRRQVPAASDEEIATALRCHGMVPALAAQYLCHSEVDPLFEEIFKLDYRQAGELVARKKDLRLDRLIEEWEQRLSSQYRQRGSDLSLRGLRERRAFLRRIRGLVTGAKVPLNKQLLVETMRMEQGH